MSRPQFTKITWEEYMYWHNQDKKTLVKLNNALGIIVRRLLCGVIKIVFKF